MQVDGWLRIATYNDDEETPTWVPARNSARELVRRVPPPFDSNITNNPEASSSSSAWNDNAGQAALDAANAEAEEMRLAVAEAAAQLEGGAHDKELLMIAEVEGGVSSSGGGAAEGEEEGTLVVSHPSADPANPRAQYEEDWDAGSFDRELAMQEEAQAREAEEHARAEEARRIAESELAAARDAAVPMNAFLDAVYRPLVGEAGSRLSQLSPKQFFKQCGRDRALAKNNAYHASGLNAADFKAILKWGGVDYLHKDCADIRAAIKVKEAAMAL